MPSRRLVLILALTGLFVSTPAPAQAKNAVIDSPKRVAAALKRGFAKGEGVAEALERAAALKGAYTDKELKPVIVALGRAFKQSVKNYQLLALDMFATLQVKGSYGQFSKLLKIPKKVQGIETRAILFRAIKTAGLLQDKDALADIERLLVHPDVAFARGAVSALASFEDLDEKTKPKLLRRLVKYFGSLEKLAKDRDADTKKRAQTLIPLLVVTLEKLSGEKGPTDAEGWKKLVSGG